MKRNASNPTYTLQRSRYMGAFSCLGDKCDDTCCKGWGMQLDLAHKKLYEQEAPELLSAVTSGEHALIMKRDPTTDFCVKFEDGLCGIHKQYGEKFLGDACNFYPRVTRALGNTGIMTGTLSCPEVARLIFFGDDPFSFGTFTTDRVPESIADYLPPDFLPEHAFTIVKAFLDMAGDESLTPQRACAQLISISRSLQHLDKKQWAEAVPFYIRSAAGRLLPAEPHQADPYRLLHGLCGLIGSSKKTERPRLMETINSMEQALHATMDWQNLQIINNASDLSAYQTLKARWQKNAEQAIKPILHRFLQSQIMLGFYPFAGFGTDTVEQATIMGVRFATVRLALMCHIQEDDTAPTPETIVRVVQSISRFLDHLMDPTLSIAFYREAGWTSESRMRGLLEDV